MNEDKAIAKRGDSANLVIRRAAWVVCKHPTPTYKGWTINPCYIRGSERAEYQARLRKWWQQLDPAAQRFLGPDWRAMCNPGDEPQPSRSRQAPATGE